MIEVPDGHFLGIFARSSTPLKRGLMVANGVGVIDADYCGPADEIKIQVLNITDAPVTVRAATAWRRGSSCPPAREWEEVDRPDPARGGFGARVRTRRRQTSNSNSTYLTL